MLEAHPHMPSHPRSHISTDKKTNKSILIHSPSYPAIGAIRRRAAWSFSTASAFAIDKAKAHDYLAWSYIIYTSTARYCWTHPHTVATEQAARLLATVSSWKQLNLWQLPRSSLTNKEKGLGLAFTRGWSESGPRHIYGLLGEPWMRHLTKDTTRTLQFCTLPGTTWPEVPVRVLHCWTRTN